MICRAGGQRGDLPKEKDNTRDGAGVPPSPIYDTYDVGHTKMTLYYTNTGSSERFGLYDAQKPGDLFVLTRDEWAQLLHMMQYVDAQNKEHK